MTREKREGGTNDRRETREGKGKEREDKGRKNK